MKKLFLTIITIHCSLITVFAQRWDSLGNGLKSNNDVLGLTVYNGNLIADGYFDTAGGQPANSIAEWNGSMWSPLGMGVAGASWCTSAWTMTIYNGNLIVGGAFGSAGGNPGTNIAEWNGTTWSNPFGSGLGFVGCSYSSDYVGTSIVYNGKLVVGGHFSIAGGIPVNNIAQWNGTQWDSLGSGLTGGNYGVVQVLDTFQGNLIVGGYFDSAGGQPAEHIAKWNGTSWTNLSSGCYRTGDGYAGVYSLTVYNGNLIAGGEFDSAGGIQAEHIAEWDGTSWSTPFGSGINGDVWALRVYKGNFVATGGFIIAGGIPASGIATWNGSNWAALGKGITWGGGFALAEYNNLLIVGGAFDTAGGMRINQIASWCDTCPPLSVAELSPAISWNEVRVYPNPSNSKLTISYNFKPGLTNATMELFDLIGNQVAHYALPAYANVVTENVGSLAAGIYLYKISFNNTVLKRGKLIITK